MSYSPGVANEVEVAAVLVAPEASVVLVEPDLEPVHARAERVRACACFGGTLSFGGVAGVECDDALVLAGVEDGTSEGAEEEEEGGEEGEECFGIHLESQVAWWRVLCVYEV